jgi:DNA repair protein RadC
MAKPKTTKERYVEIEWILKERAGEYKTIQSPQDIYENYHHKFDQEVKEKFIVFFLDSFNGIIGSDTISIGTLNSSIIHPREVFRAAVQLPCASIVIAHNHPSGNLEPSNEDLQITKQMIEAGKILGIPIHDHIIFTRKGYTSFAERSLM